MKFRFASLLFPEEPRAFRGRRGLKISLRALHVLAAGVLTGGYLLAVPGEARQFWLWATLATGGLILLLDLHESAAFLLQVRGLVVAGKLLVLALLPHLPPGRQPWVLAALVVLSVLSSHAPGAIRHRVVIGRGRVRGAKTQG